VGVVGDGNDGLGLVASLLDDVGLTGAKSLALQVNVDTLLLSLTLLESVLLDTLDEVLAGAGVLDVLNADADALLEVAVIDLLVEDDTDGGLGDVVDDTGLTVVDLVGHTVQLLDFRMFQDSHCLCCMIAVGGRGECAGWDVRRKVLTPSGRHR
jgi:hypothetical protein